MEKDTNDRIPSTAPAKFLKPYSAAEYEPNVYQAWESSGFFNPDVCIEKGITKPDAPHFSMVLPPPNVTGNLHTGHALMLVIQDIMVRHARMQGKKTLWLPGTDHAAIATQSKVEKLLEKEGVRKNDLGREEFLKHVNQFAQDSHDTIVNQCKKMGASLDWSREAFTLDEKRNLAVRTAFKQMFDDKLIYRKYRVVNWDPKGQTVISDDEIVYEERDAVLYTFKYWKDFPISISTTRPETKVGDAAVAVHPDDARYQKYIGQTFTGTFCGVDLSIKIIADRGVEPEFGTGALGVTPAHSKIDWDMAQKNDLPVIPIINEFAKMIVGGELLMGKKTSEAKEIVAQWLRDQGLMEKEEKIKQNVSTAERTGAIIEPLPKLQWFIDVNKPIVARENKTLKELMQDAVTKHGLQILPDRFEKTYLHWIENLQDWCISRQIWYGHRIPVWYDKQENIHLPKRIKVYLARHGQSEFNLSKVFLTQKEADETPLTEQGKADAKALAESIKDKKITKIIRSNLLRAKQTTDIVLAELGRNADEVEIWDELQEVRIGDHVGQEKPKDYNPLKFSIENNIQTLDEVETQGNTVLQKLKALPDGEQVLVIGHGAIHSVFLAINKGLPKDKFLEHKAKLGTPKNGSFYEMSVFADPEGSDLVQDPDTLDTWFSSGLWTFSTLGWPEKTSDLATYHPTSVLETGHDILPFWVARMILMSTYLLGEVPFKTVYLHGMVRTADGKKMSKSLGEKAIDPLDIIAKYGNDALRMAMIVGNTPGNDLKLDENDIRGYGKFANKMWNATRFVLEQTHGLDISNLPAFDEEDAVSDKELKDLLAEVSKEMDEFRYSLVAEKFYHYFWHTFADVIIERSKTKITEGRNADSAKALLYTQLVILLKALHPFMPFVTEEIWQSIPAPTSTSLGGPEPKEKRLLMVEQWPQ